MEIELENSEHATIRDLLDRFTDPKANICLILPVKIFAEYCEGEDPTDDDDEISRLLSPKKTVKRVKSNDGVALAVEKEWEKRSEVKGEIKTEDADDKATSRRSARITKGISRKRQKEAERGRMIITSLSI